MRFGNYDPIQSKINDNRQYYLEKGYYCMSVQSPRLFRRIHTLLIQTKIAEAKCQTQHFKT